MLSSLNEYASRWVIHPRIVWVLLVLALALRLFHLDYRGFWNDEFKTLEAVRLETSALIEHRTSNGHFPTYFLGLRAWRQLAGESEIALRLPSAVIGAAAVWFLYALAASAWGRRAALWVALFYLLHQRMLWAGQEARSYAIVMFLAAASLQALWQAERASGRQRGGWWALYVFWSLLGLVMHGSYAFAYLSQLLVGVLWTLRQRRWRWGGWGAHLVILGLGAMAYGWLNAHHTHRGFYKEASWPDLWHLAQALMQICWGDYRVALGSGFKYLGLPLGIAGLVLGLRAAWRCERSPETRAAGAPLAIYALAWALMAIVMITLISGLGQNIRSGFGYYAVSVGGASLLLGAAVGLGQRGWWQRIGIGLCLLIYGALAIGWLWAPRDQVREAVRLVARERLADEPVIFCKAGQSRLIAEYYQLGVAPLGIDRDLEAPEAVIAALRAAVGDAPGFWLIVYDQKDSPIGSLARAIPDWPYRVKKTAKLVEVTVFHGRRRPTGEDSI